MFCDVDFIEFRVLTNRRTAKGSGDPKALLTTSWPSCDSLGHLGRLGGVLRSWVRICFLRNDVDIQMDTHTDVVSGEKAAKFQIGPTLSKGVESFFGGSVLACASTRSNKFDKCLRTRTSPDLDS